MRRPILAAILLLPSGCSLRSIALRQSAAIVDAGTPSLSREQDPDLAREAMPGQLKLLESFLESAPKDPHLLKAAASGFAAYAQLFIEDQSPDRAAAFYRRALGYSLRLAALDPGLKNLEVLGPAELESSLRRARKSDVPALYWAALAWAGWAQNAKNDAQALLGVPAAARLMSRVLELEPAYENGGPELWFGVYHCARPKIAGGDPEKGRAGFESALLRTQGRYLTAKLLYARYYAVAVSDKELFVRLLTEVRDGTPLPEARLADEVAKRKAALLLQKADELF
ncbi:MAG: TRAP transporter TatT component family protein [Elusimicrobiota bacterium]|jgi:hypothetical protein